METTGQLTPKAKKLLRTAKQLFVENSIHRIGVDQIVLESDVTKATLYKYFGSKEGLLIKCIKSEVQKSKDSIQELLNNCSGIESLRLLHEWHLSFRDFSPTGGTLLCKGSVELAYIPEVVTALEEYQEWKFQLLILLAKESGCKEEAKVKILMNLFNSILAPYNKIYPTWEEILDVLKISI